MSKWQEKPTPGAAGLYGGAGVAYYGPAGAHLHAGRLVLTAAVSAGAYFAGTKLCPTRVVRTYVLCHRQ